MIHKLRKKVFYAIFITLSILIIGAIGIFAFINYRNINFFGDRAFMEKPEEDIPPEESEERPKPPEMDEEVEEVRQKFQQYARDRTRTLVIVALSGSCIGLLVSYIISKKVSNWIVSPVEETFSKQVQFISDASHELKTPLAVIEANSDVLENEIGDNKWLKYIQNETQNMDKLINELLLLAKMEKKVSKNMNCLIYLKKQKWLQVYLKVWLLKKELKSKQISKRKFNLMEIART